MIKEEEVFLEKYKDCAPQNALEFIWKGLLEKTKLIGLGNYKITDLSPFEVLLDLKELEVTGGLFNDLNPLKGLKYLEKLTFYSTQVIDLSPLRDLNQLRYLNISSTQVIDLSPLRDLGNLEQLIVSSTHVSDLSPLRNLGKLKRLNISSTQVTDLSPLGDLGNLEQLIVSSTPISDLSPLRNVETLQYLNISSTKVMELSPLKDLVKLRYLNISSTKLSDLSPLENLSNLKKLYLGQTNIKDLSPIKNLAKLVFLHTGNTGIIDLTPLTSLHSLQILYIHQTDIANLEPIKGLTNLNVFYASNTKINELSALRNCKNLKEIYLSNTKIANLEPLENLQNLKAVSLSKTMVHDLMPLRKQIEKGLDINPTGKWSKGIHIKNSPITNPPIEIVEDGREAILRYWKEKERVGSRKIREARLLLLGQGETGKTTLKEKIRDRNAPMPKLDERTKGIDIEPIVCKNAEGEDFIVQIWDFGGQNIQKYAHQFFMSDSVVYAVLTDERKQDRNFNYWFSIIELLGKDSPFFVVQNEKEGHLEALKDLTQIQERYPKTLKGVRPVNLKNAANDWRFDNLRTELLKTATELPHTQAEYINSFFNIRQQLATLAEKEQTLSFKDFRQLCSNEKIEDPKLMNDYARRFTQLGIALHFEGNLHLKPHIFLNPKWIIDALFHLLYHSSVIEQKGLFTDADTGRIWSEQQYDDMHGVLVQLMVEFKLCYETTNKGQYIVPQRLPTRTEPFIPSIDATHIVYCYKFLPSGLLTQLTCSLHHLIEGEKVWSDAVQFIDKNGKGRVFVRENEADHKIEIFGFDAQKADLLNKVVEALDTIHSHSKFGNLQVKKQVPCPCDDCIDARKKQEVGYFFNFDMLIRDLNNGDFESDKCEVSRKKFPIIFILKYSKLKSSVIKQIRDLVANDKVEEALNLLSDWFKNDNEVNLFSARLAHYNKEWRKGLTDSVKERNKIISGILDMLTEWEDS